jgi:ABC-2 type transport system ATP-binding protein
MTTHYMEEADQLCDRVAIIDHGTIVALGSPAELKRKIRADQVVHLLVRSAGATIDGRFLDQIRTCAEVVDESASDGAVRITVHCSSAPELVGRAFQAAASTSTAIEHVEIVPVSLEEVFLALTGRALRD